MGSQDPTARKFLSLINLELKLLSRHPWPELIKQAVIDLAHGQDEYPLPADFDRPIPNTAYNLGEVSPFYPTDEAQEQYIENIAQSSYDFQRIQVKGVSNNRIKIYPPPAFSNILSVLPWLRFSYISTNTIKPKTFVNGEQIYINDWREWNGNYYKSLSSGVASLPAPSHTFGSSTYGEVTWAYQDVVYNTFRQDTDEPVLDSTLIELAAEYLYLKSSGFKFEDSYALYISYRDSRINSQTPAKSFSARNVTDYADLDYPILPWEYS